MLSRTTFVAFAVIGSFWAVISLWPSWPKETPPAKAWTDWGIAAIALITVFIDFRWHLQPAYEVDAWPEWRPEWGPEVWISDKNAKPGCEMDETFRIFIPRKVHKRGFNPIVSLESLVEWAIPCNFAKPKISFFGNVTVCLAKGSSGKQKVPIRVLIERG